MVAGPRSFPSNDEGSHICQRLVAGDLTASTDLAEAYLAPLIGWLIEHNRRIDPDLCAEAADQAIVALIKNPGSYQPERQSLDVYLRMSAQGDLRNLLNKERRHVIGRRSLESVELSADGRKYLGEDDDPSLRIQIEEARQENLAAVPPAVREGLNEQELAVLELMLTGERKTEVYARAYGIEHLSAEEQQREVKRVKDRLQKRLERARCADE